MLANPDNWPYHLRHMVRSFGAERVHFEGQEYLGFPPSWTGSISECKQLATFLEGKSHVD